MTDYIKREDAINVFYWNEDLYVRCGIATQNIKDIPSADVIEVDKVNKIYEKLADLLGIPCNYSPCDEIMLESGRCLEDCGDIPDAECWRRYFEVVCDGERREA